MGVDQSGDERSLKTNCLNWPLLIQATSRLRGREFDALSVSNIRSIVCSPRSLSNGRIRGTWIIAADSMAFMTPKRCPISQCGPTCAGITLINMRFYF